MTGGFLEQARGLNREQRSAFVASFLGWTMDAFDYFLIVFVFAEIADDLNTSLIKVQVATTLTLAARPVGALAFGLLADRYGRRMPLMVDVAFYSVVEFLTGQTLGWRWLFFLGSLPALLVLAAWGRPVVP